MTDEAKINTEIKIIQQPTTERTQARGAIVPPTVIPVWEALRNNDTFPSLDITDDTTDDEINRFLYGNDYDLDAEIKLIQQHMHQSCVKRLIARRDDRGGSVGAGVGDNPCTVASALATVANVRGTGWTNHDGRRTNKIGGMVND